MFAHQILSNILEHLKGLGLICGSHGNLITVTTIGPIVFLSYDGTNTPAVISCPGQTTRWMTQGDKESFSAFELRVATKIVEVLLRANYNHYSTGRPLNGH